MTPPTGSQEHEIEALRRRVTELERLLQLRADPAPSATDFAAPGFAGLLQAFMDSTPDWLFAKDLQFRFLFVNRSFAAAQGLTPADMIGRCDTEFWGLEQCEPDPATGHQGFHADDRRAFAGETVHNPRDQATVADGSLRVFDTVKSPLRTADGRVLGVLCYCRDVTDRDVAENALRQSEERFRTVVGNIPGSVYRSEAVPPYRGVFLSEGIQSITGYAAHEHSEPGGPSCRDLILPEDRARVDAAMQAAVATRQPFQVRYRIRHRDGSIRWLSEQGRATYAPDGTPLHLDGVHIDVTAEVAAEASLRQSEEQLRTIVQTEPECVKLLDREGRVLEMNPAGLRMIEADSIEQVRGHGVGPIVHAADRAAFQRMVAAVFRGEAQTLVFDVVGLKGTRRTLETHGVPMWADAEHREVRALLGVTRDITARLRAEQARQALESQLRQAQKLQAMGTLARGIAHDFNNILTAILGHAELLELAPRTDADQRESVAGILAAAKRARDLVLQILTFGQRREHERRVVALQPLVQEMLQMLRATLPATIVIRTDFASEGNEILAEATQVHQVLLNLCTNAAHAMREGGGTLLVSCGTVQVDDAFCRLHPGMRPGPHVRLSVSDTGHGMDAATLERIFEPFFTTKNQGEGSGLGLAVVHGIMQNHGGCVTVSSQPGKGTTFDLHFPVAEAPAPAEAAARETAVAGHGEHVLVVDDEPVLVDLTRRMLTGLGYRVTGHHRPVEALEDFRRDPSRFDLVLCDLAMPGVNGLQFAAAVGAVRPELPVLLTSGDASQLEPERLQQFGVREVLPKPFQLRHLAAAVGRYLRSPG